MPKTVLLNDFSNSNTDSYFYHTRAILYGKKWAQGLNWRLRDLGLYLNLETITVQSWEHNTTPGKFKFPHVNFLKNNYFYFSWLWELYKTYLSSAGTCPINDNSLPYFTVLPFKWGFTRTHLSITNSSTQLFTEIMLRCLHPGFKR